MRLRLACVAMVLLLAAGCLAPPPSPAPPGGDFRAASPAAPTSTANISAPAAAPAPTTPKANITPQSPPADPPGPALVVTTRNGTFAIALDPEAAPRTVAHVADLAARGFYDGLPFHRYVANFVLQGGDPSCANGAWNASFSSCGTGGSGEPMPLEVSANATHDFGAVGMAHGKSTPGDSQFYVVLNATGAHSLDGKFTVIGHVVQGMDVVLKLRRGEVMTSVRYVPA